MTTAFLALAASLGGAEAPATECIAQLLKADGRELYCCTDSSGQQCCSPRLDENGRPAGCDC